MTWVISKKKKYAGYTLYVLLLTLVCLYYRFPSEALAQYLRSFMEKGYPGYHLTIREVRPTLPLGVHISGAKVSSRARPDVPLFSASTASIRPEILSFLRGRSGYRFDCRAYGGRLEGSVHRGDKDTAIASSMTFKNMRLEPFPPLAGHTLTGTLNGTVTYEGQEDLSKGTGEADLTISEGRLELPQPILIFNTLDFSDLSVKLVLKNRKVNLARFEMKGKAVQGELSGTIALTGDLSQSRLNLRGTIEPLASFFQDRRGENNIIRRLTRRHKGGKISFLIYGTINDPKIRIM